MSSDLPDGLLGSAGGDREGDGSSRSADDEQTFRRFLFLDIGRHRLAIPIEDVRAITDPPAETTRVPRSPAAIEGVTDIRGQITVLVDPHVHFPDSGGPGPKPSLLVFDRPDQPAAITVDEVRGVESVPVDDVIPADDFDPEAVEGTPLAHPLVVGVVRQEHRVRDPMVEAIAAGQSAAAEAGAAEARGQDDPTVDLFDGEGNPEADDEFGVEVDEFSLDEEEPEAEPEPEPADVEVEVEVTPLLDVDRLLLASGRVSESAIDGVGAARSE